MLATLNPVESKISRCENDKGQVTFSDSGCDRAIQKSTQNPLDSNSILPVAEQEKEQVNKVYFYCHKGAKKFTKC